MRCPYCHDDNDRVIDSRSSQDRFSIRRRRECLACHRRYTTYERLEEMDIRVIKKDGVREPFDPEKIRQGLLRACWKRPVSGEQIETIVADVEREIYADFENEIESQRLGEIVMERLHEVDQVAYVRFASVYRRFEDVHDFVDELQPMLKSRLETAAGRPPSAEAAHSEGRPTEADRPKNADKPRAAAKASHRETPSARPGTSDKPSQRAKPSNGATPRQGKAD